MKTTKKRILAALFVLVAAGLLVYFLFFSPETIAPGSHEPAENPDKPPARTALAEREAITLWYDAIGTVIPTTQARIEAQVSAQVNEVLVQTGDRVKKGDLLVRLEDERLRSRFSQAQQSLQAAVSEREQARQGVNAAEAAFAQAKSAFNRIESFYEKQAATEQELEEARSRFLQAQAGLRRAKNGLEGAEAGIRRAEQMVEEAKISAGYTNITAPGDGEVLKRLVDPGDMAMPGKALLTLRTAGGFQLEASVREGLMATVQPGDTYSVRLTALDLTVEAVIEEIVPFIDPQTRTFEVKAALPAAEGVYPGMYGKLLIPSGRTTVILIPRQAVLHAGQLQLVSVLDGDRLQRRSIQTGNIHGDKVEVLAGLDGGEEIVLREQKSDG